MNYQHRFHAGNAGDVLKHVLLIGVLQAMARKNTPYAYLDTHAGGGLYDLTGPAARKTNEFQSGIGQLWKLRTAKDLPPLVHAYLKIVEGYNPNGKLEFYPGSPLIAQSLARPSERLMLVEHVTEVAAQLKAQCAKDSRIAVHISDGYTALKSLLPPREQKRGVILIDPPYEDANEFAHIVEALPQAQQRWPTGVFLVWYPITAYSEDAHMLAQLRNSGMRNILTVEWCWHACRMPRGMNGCGMLVVNPPWQFAAEITNTLSWLHQHLAPDSSVGMTRVSWCVEE